MIVQNKFETNNLEHQVRYIGNNIKETLRIFYLDFAVDQNMFVYI